MCFQLLYKPLSDGNLSADVFKRFSVHTPCRLCLSATPPSSATVLYPLPCHSKNTNMPIKKQPPLYQIYKICPVTDKHNNTCHSAKLLFPKHPNQKQNSGGNCNGSINYKVTCKYNRRYKRCCSHNK